MKSDYLYFGAESTALSLSWKFHKSHNCG